MTLEFRYLYENPNPVPASQWGPVQHAMTVPVPGALLAVQFRDPDQPIDEDDPKNAITVVLNAAVEMMTDSRGFLNDTDPELIAEVERLAAEKGIEL